MTGSPLLNRQDPNPVRKTVSNAADSPFVLIGDHAGTAIPAALGDLGLSAADRARHIAVDIGVEALGQALSKRLGAPFVSQAYSRLVVDCNRDPDHRGWIAEESDGTPIPGNRDLSREQRTARRVEIFDPYHAAVAKALDTRAAQGRDSVLVALHSFTPVMNGETRPWHVGVLHAGHEDGFAHAVLERLRERSGLVVGDNKPYRMDPTDYTVFRHAFPRGLRYVEIEVRQDLLASEPGVSEISELLGEVISPSR